MTYRDTEDALRARIQALESKLGHRARERTELEQELEQAREDLASRHPPQLPRSPILLWIGAAGAALTALLIVLLHLILPRVLSPLLYMLSFVVVDIALGLGLVGVRRVTGQRLALTAAILLLIAPLGLLVYLFGLSVGFSYAGWLRSLVATVVLGVVLIRIQDLRIPPWKRKVTGGLFVAGGLVEVILFGLFVLGRPSDAAELNRLVSSVLTGAAVARMIGLALCLHDLNRTDQQRSRTGVA